MASHVTASPIRPAAPVVLQLNAGSVYRVLLCVIVVLATLSTLSKGIMLALPAGEYGAVNELCKRFYLDFENNIPAWCSTLGLFVASCLLGLIALIHRRREESLMWPWLGLSLLFTALAIDEATFIHEILIVSLRDRLSLSGIFYFAWVIPGAVFVAAVAVFYLPFLLRLPSATRNGLLLAGASYVGGALGVELLGGYFAESQGFDSASYIFVMTVEESLEMFGIITLIYVLLRHLAWQSPDALKIQWQQG